MKGWIKLHRTLQLHWLWNTEKPFDKRSAWIDLLLLANHEDGKTLFDNELVVVKRGEHITSEVKLAERWGWSRTKVRNFLNLLQKDGMIENIKEDKKRTRIRIVNYSIYQDSKDNKKTSENTTKEQEENKGRTRGEQEENINKNDKNDKNKEDILSPSEQTQDKIPYQEIAELYNSIAVSLPKVKSLSDRRKRAIKTSWNKFKDISVFKTVFEKAEASDFLSGRNNKWTGCNFDWLINYNNMIKVLEGTYDNKASSEGNKIIDYEAASKSKYGW